MKHPKTPDGADLSDSKARPPVTLASWLPPLSGGSAKTFSPQDTTLSAESSSSLEEHTEASSRPSVPALPEPLDADALLARIATVAGFCGGAVLDIEWGELLGANSHAELDVDLAAQLALASLTMVEGQWPEEVITTTSTHHEIITTLRTPVLTMICYTLWQRDRTNLAIARAALPKALASAHL